MSGEFKHQSHLDDLHWRTMGLGSKHQALVTPYRAELQMDIHNAQLRRGRVNIHSGPNLARTCRIDPAIRTLQTTHTFGRPARVE